jgi:hypothetical protein
LECLIQSIQLEDSVKTDKALQGLAFLENENSDWEKIQKFLERIRRDFDREKQITYKKYETVLKQKLENAGIRGSAVQPNLTRNDDWQRTLNGMLRTYEPKMKELRKEMAEWLLVK